ncbi:hypothetical protein [Sporosalibacterium faouarense]|nr:hypothetical protein [Sporosalibacterium faouarense]
MNQKLTFKFRPRLDKLREDIIKELSFHTIKLYNIVNYNLRVQSLQYFV